MKKINVGIVGFGTVGAGVADILIKKRQFILERTGVDINLKYIADVDIKKDRGVNVPKDILIKDYKKIIDDTEVDIVVELVGGVSVASEVILKALCSGKHVVTANKALLSSRWEELMSKALENNVEIKYEASVAGGVPIIKALQESLSVNKITAIFGIINGTANYILTEMRDEEQNLDVVLKEAQRLGYAEADPTYDIEGIDTAHKLSILVMLAFGARAKVEDIYTQGITDITLNDIRYADRLGYSIKLLAIAKDLGDKIEARVHPTLIRKDNLLASINGVFNGVYIKGDSVGGTIFYGRGAGRYPTASAVVSDIIDIGKRIGTDYEVFSSKIDESKKILDVNDIYSRYYIRFSVEDRPGVLAGIANVFSNKNISISSVIQQEESEDEAPVPLVIMTHEALERDMAEAIESIKKLEFVGSDVVFIRVEG
ncbi:homoserine dehydrogenase [bacterium]|nr:homoserine dehydrogenase [bacterium]